MDRHNNKPFLREEFEYSKNFENSKRETEKTEEVIERDRQFQRRSIRIVTKNQKEEEFIEAFSNKLSAD